MTFTIAPGYTWTSGETVTATKLTSTATPTLAADQSYTFNVGAAATPSVNFTGATTTGLYYAASTLGFTVAAASVGTMAASTFTWGGGATVKAVVVNGGTGNSNGGYVQFSRNSVAKGYIGSEAAVPGTGTNNLDNLCLSAVGATMRFYTDNGANLAMYFTSGVVYPYGALTMAGGGVITASTPTTSYASVNFPHGVAPSSPTNGDMWTTSSGLFIRINGVTKTVTLA